jgi:hypothetical protein
VYVAGWEPETQVLVEKQGLAMKRSIRTAVVFFFLATPAGAQECKVKFAVAHWDGKALEIGLTADQAKFWNRERAKRYPTFCLDGTAPDYVVAWTERSSSAEIAKLTVRRGAGGSNAESVITVPLDEGGASAHYFIFDLSKQPAEVIRTGVGLRDAPAVLGSPLPTGSRPGDTVVDVSHLAATVPDPAEAMKNALDWLKKKH